MPRLDLNWKIALVTALLLPLLLAMGFWQLDREGEKRALQAIYDQRLAQAPVALASLPLDADELAYRRVQISGEYDNSRNFLLDNRIYESRIGYELLTPLRTELGLMLVNRGWLPMGASRQQLPALPAITGEQLVSASVYVPPGETFVLSNIQEQPAGQWPQVIQRVDMALIEEVLGEPVFPYTLRISADSPGAQLAQWPVISMSPETHRGYAVQWFTMAAVLLFMFVYVSVKRRGKEA